MITIVAVREDGYFLLSGGCLPPSNSHRVFYMVVGLQGANLGFLGGARAPPTLVVRTSLLFGMRLNYENSWRKPIVL